MTIKLMIPEINENQRGWLKDKLLKIVNTEYPAFASDEVNGFREVIRTQIEELFDDSPRIS